MIELLLILILAVLGWIGLSIYRIARVVGMVRRRHGLDRF